MVRPPSQAPSKATAPADTKLDGMGKTMSLANNSTTKSPTVARPATGVSSCALHALMGSSHSANGIKISANTKPVRAVQRSHGFTARKNP
jgi:hypothetical protein